MTTLRRPLPHRHVQWLPALAVGVAAHLASWAEAPPAPSSSTLPPPFSAPFVPTADSQVLQQVPAASDPKVAEMRSLRARLDATPRDAETAHRLADAYVDFGRQLGDAHYAGYAEAVIAPWLAQAQPGARTLVVYATILQYRHQFAEAREALHKALLRDPKNEQGWLTLATLDMVQGDYSAASHNCAQVTSTGNYAVGAACAASLRSYIGQAQQGITMLGLLVGNGAALPASFKAWTEGLLAESNERLGNWAEAERHYRNALGFTPEDNFLLVAYADFLLDRSRPNEVLTLLADHTQSDTAFLRLVLARSALASPDLPRYVWTMAARFEALRQRGSEYFGREEVRFALDLQHDPASALALAQANWQAQREPWDARVFLQAALAANQPQAAMPVLDFIERSKLQDPVIEALAKNLRTRLARPAGAAS
jgi:Tfp pilus assembly protein PilF